MSQDFTHRLRVLMQSVGFSSFKSLSQAANVSEKQLLRLRRGELASVRVETLLKLSQVLQVSVAEFLGEGSRESGVGSRESGIGSRESGVGSRESGVGSRESGVGSRESGVGSRESGVGSRESKLSSVAAQSATQTSNLKPQTSNLKPQNSFPPPELSDLRQEYDRLQQQLVQQRELLWQEFQQSSVQILESLLLQLPTAAYAAQQNPQAPAVKLLPLLRPLDTLLATWGIAPIATVGAEIPYDPQQHQLIGGTAQRGDRVKVRYTGYQQGDRLLYRAKVSAIDA